MKSNYLILFFVGLGFSSNLGCEDFDFDNIIKDIQKYGSSFELIIAQDTIYSTHIISYKDDIITINLLNEKWSNYSINQYFNEEYNSGTSVPFEIPLGQIDCIKEIYRPNLLREYSYIGLTAIVFWGILTIFQLI